VENYRTLFGASGAVYNANPRTYAAANRCTGFIGTGGGSFTSVSNVGTTTNFRDDQPEAMLFQLGGSGLGNFDTENGILKACISLNYGLLSVFTIRPWVLFPHAGLGYHVGYDYQKSVNFLQFPTRQMVLLGDPTLRFNLMPPVPSATHDAEGLVAWDAAEGADGYAVFRLNGQILVPEATTTNLTYAGTPAPRYAVKAFRDQASATGSYRNSSMAVEAAPIGRRRGFLFIMTGAALSEDE